MNVDVLVEECDFGECYYVDCGCEYVELCGCVLL